MKTPGAITEPAPAPKLGQHTDELLRKRLGYDDAFEGNRRSCAGRARSALFFFFFFFFFRV